MAMVSGRAMMRIQMPACRRPFAVFLTAALLAAISPSVEAEPVLQLYLEGAEYDSSTESWTLSPTGSSAGDPFRLWVIGWTKKWRPISNVRVAAAYDESWGQLQITLTPTTTGDLGGFTDPSIADADLDTPGIQGPEFLQFVTDGSVPVLGDGRNLPNHGEYGDGIVWQEFGLGDFQLLDSPIADFIDSFPDPAKANQAQINVYDVTILAEDGGSAHGARVHFDAYDTVTSRQRGVFAPFSHDADGTANVVPLPPAAWAGMGLLTLIGVVRARRRRSLTD